MAMDWDIPVLHNYAVDHLFKYNNKCRRGRLFRQEIRMIAMKTEDAADPLRCLAIDESVYKIRVQYRHQERREQLIDYLSKRTPLKFLTDVLKGASKPRIPAESLKAPSCTYHRHKEGEKCP